MKINFIASLEEDCRDRIDTIAGQMEQKGCTIRHILRFSGVIAGRVDEATPLDSIKVPGIKHIEKDREIRATEEEE